jgi:isopenicillin N synthase-like dioxygenase
LDTEEKLKYRADLENGGYNGYKPMGLREIVPGVFDNTEIYNIPKFIPECELPHPELIHENWAEISKFGKHIHHDVVSKLLSLFEIILELPEGYLLERHRYGEKSDCHLRYMKYHARTPEVNASLNDVWVKGHTDFGSLTLLFRQPIAALQVRTPQETWKYVKPYPGSITVNIADSLSFLTNGYLKSSIHRVVAPPPDQAHLDRLGVLYFVRPEDKLILKPVPSPLLDRLGLKSEVDENAPSITAGEWVKARVAKNVNKVGDSKTMGGEQEIIKGVKAKYYD